MFYDQLVGYRDAVKLARTQLDEARETLRERESKLSGEDEAELPEGLRTRLTELRAALTPTEDTMDAIRGAEQALDGYRRALTESVDLLAQKRGAEARGEDFRARPSSGGRRMLGRVATLGALIAIVVWMPGWLVEHAEAAAEECIVEHDARDELIGEDCTQGLWLWPAAAFVWERGAATDEMDDIGRRSFQHDVEQVASGHPNRADRDRMAETVLAHEAWPRARRVETVFRMGAFEVLAASELAHARPEGFYAARAVADIDRANALAAESIDRTAFPLAHSFDLRRGAWLCLHGDAVRGREILVRALADELGDSAEQEALAEAAFACDPKAGGVGLGAHLTYERRRDLSMLDPTWQVGRRAGIARGWLDETASAAGARRLTPAALMVLHGRLTDAEVLALLAPAAPGQERGLAPSAILFPDNEGLFTRWSTLRLTERPAPVESLLEAADHLVKMAEELQADSAPPLEIPELSRDAIAWSAREDPAAVLLRAAWAMRLQAALELSRTGAHPRVLEVIRKADAVAPPRYVWLSAGLLHAAGDAKGAAAKLDAFMEGDEYAQLEAADRVMLGLERALSQASLGEYESAARSARDAYELSQVEVDGAALGANPRWLHAALALHTGGPPPEPGDDAWASALSDEHARSVFRSEDYYSDPFVELVAVAEPYALGHTAGEGGEAEAWLSRVMSRRFDPGSATPGLRRAMWARVEAAAWRGDADAESQWRERVTRIEAKIVDGRTVVLAHHAGL